MRYLIFAPIVAFILEHHGTFQTEDRHPLSSEQEIALFQQNAVKLLNAAAQALCTKGRILNLCECISVIEGVRELEPLYLVLAATAMADNYHRELNAIQRYSDVSPDELSNGMKQLISKMITILRFSNDNFDLSSMDGTLRRHLRDSNLNALYPRSTSTDDDRNLRLGTKCYRMIIAMNYGRNRQSFTDILRGFEIVRDVIQDKPNKDALMPEFDSIVDQVAHRPLQNPDSSFKRDDLEEVIEMLKSKQ